uniref:MARVEL domain containing 2b n=1 Tax=Scleropages formosus TaxID=113540 RepID=A0A8C9RNG7_SCLFO
MSSGCGSSARFDRIRDVRCVAEVPEIQFEREVGPVPREEVGRAEQTLGSNPIAALSFPAHYPVGPEFYPSDSEESLHVTEEHSVCRSIPGSVREFFQRTDRRSKRGSTERRSKQGSAPVSQSNISSRNATSSVFQQPKRTMSEGSDNFRKEHEATLFDEPVRSVDGRTFHTALTYEERMAVYQQHYGYMKTWAGMLRILGCVQLLFGAAVFACACAYVYKDNEWYTMFGNTQPQAYGGYLSGMGSMGSMGSMGGMGSYGGSGFGGIYYTGPQTPFVLVVAGLAWVVTVILLVLGMTMHYRTVLLNSAWWPIMEFFTNLVLAVLYLAAAIVYVRDTRRGGLCDYPTFNVGISGGFCQTEPGQTAAIVFLFVTFLLYVASAVVCIKLQRHEAARMRRERSGQENYGDLRAPPPKEAEVTRIQPEVSDGHLPSGPFPEPVFIPDYTEKYPSIHTEEERDRYRAVFNDQYAEYKELNAEVQVVLKRFDELDALMRSLSSQPYNQMEQARIQEILHEYQRKKMDPSFLEKRERCEYLKSKLSHIKQKIQEYDKIMDWNDGCS